MASFSKTKFFVFCSVTSAHVALIGGLSCVETQTEPVSEKFILVEFVPEEKPPLPPPPPDELPVDNANAPEAAEVSAAEMPAEAPPPPMPSPEDYVLESSRDSAPGKDGEVFGDAPDAAEKKAVSAPEQTEPALDATRACEKKEAPADPDPESKETPEAGGKTIGKQGLKNAQQDGKFGSGGSGGDSATSTVRYKRRVAPKYPRADKLAGRTGTVILLLEIDAEGKLLNVSIRRSSGSRSLDAAAIQAARASKYLPAHDGERHIPSRAEASYTFSR